MASVPAANETLEAIVKEVKKMDDLERSILLTRLRVKRMGKVPAVANPPKGLQPPTLEQINQWKHEALKQNADK